MAFIQSVLRAGSRNFRHWLLHRPRYREGFHGSPSPALFADRVIQASDALQLGRSDNPIRFSIASPRSYGKRPQSRSNQDHVKVVTTVARRQVKKFWPFLRGIFRARDTPPDHEHPANSYRGHAYRYCRSLASGRHPCHGMARHGSRLDSPRHDHPSTHHPSSGSHSHPNSSLIRVRPSQELTYGLPWHYPSARKPPSRVRGGFLGATTVWSPPARNPRSAPEAEEYRGLHMIVEGQH